MSAILPTLYRRLADIFSELDAWGFIENDEFGATAGIDNTWFILPKAYHHILTDARCKEWLAEIQLITFVQEVKYEFDPVMFGDNYIETGLKIFYTPDKNARKGSL